METNATYRKTPKGEQEIINRTGGLSARLRSVLIMADGRITGAELRRRARALGDGEALVAALIEGGYIEAARRSAESASTGIPPSQAYAETIRYASRFIVETLGPAFDELGVRIETCHDPGALLRLLENVREVIGAHIGRKKVEAFWAGVTARLPAT